MKFNIITLPTNNYNYLEKHLSDSKDKGLSHLVIDDNEGRQMFLKNIFINENKFTYLKKIYDLEDDGFKYHVKVFEINYKSLNNQNYV